MCQDYHKIIPRWPLDHQDAFGIYSWLDPDVSGLSQDYSKMTSWASRCFWHLFLRTSWCVKFFSRSFKDYLLSIKRILTFFRGDIHLYQDNYKIMPRWHISHQDASGIYSRWHQSYSFKETPINVFKLTHIFQCRPSQVCVWASTLT